MHPWLGLFDDPALYEALDVSWQAIELHSAHTNSNEPALLCQTLLYLYEKLIMLKLRICPKAKLPIARAIAEAHFR
jgi:hypothetical protein